MRCTGLLVLSPCTLKRPLGCSFLGHWGLLVLCSPAVSPHEDGSVTQVRETSFGGLVPRSSDGGRAAHPHALLLTRACDHGTCSPVSSSSVDLCVFPNEGSQHASKQIVAESGLMPSPEAKPTSRVPASRPLQASSDRVAMCYRNPFTVPWKLSVMH